MRLYWADHLKEERPGAIAQTCRQCGGIFWLPPSKVGRRVTCSKTCASVFAIRMKLSKMRVCETCGDPFEHKGGTRGRGKYCSQACNTAGLAAINRPEIKTKAKTQMRLKREAGEVRYRRGPSNPRWKGGEEAAAIRFNERYLQRKLSGESAAKLRAYRKENPHKVREFSRRRASRKIGGLPSGTIPTIMQAQRHRCAICRRSIRSGYHVDHIRPLARGGAHIARNIQLLCPPCNLKKSHHDPIDHMQTLGRLL